MKTAERASAGWPRPSPTRAAARPRLAVLALGLAAAIVPPARGHGGEDHGDAPHPPPAPVAVAPRFESRTDLFELVGVLQGRQLVLWLDRADSNAPLPQAAIEIESGSHRARAVPAADGSLRVDAGPLATPGRHALTITVEADGEADLLTARFDHAPAGAVSAASAPAPAGPGASFALPKAALAVIAGSLVLVAAGAAMAWRRRRLGSA